MKNRRSRTHPRCVPTPRQATPGSGSRPHEGLSPTDEDDSNNTAGELNDDFYNRFDSQRALGPE